VLVRKSNFEARTECEVMRVNLDRAGKWATGVTYVDSSGEEWEQPADIVLYLLHQDHPRGCARHPRLSKYGPAGV